MKTKKILAILVLLVGLMLGQAEVTNAIPMGTAFTYQGRLMDANSAADGLYDFQFRIYNDPCTGTQQANPIDINDLDVIDGYFTVELDFGSDVFDGDARWLEIAVMPGDSMGRITTLSPRQEITPAPYALYAASAGGDGDWAVDGQDMYAIPSGNVGIGTVPTSAAKLEVITSSGTGVHGETSANVGSGVSGIASNTGNVINYGGYFMSEGGNGRGVVAGASGSSGKGVYGVATNPNDVTNYGGYFYSSGGFGRGVYGEAARFGRYTNYGGYFLAKGDTGRGVYGEATGDEGYGVYGIASDIFAYFNYGGYFESAGISGRGVYGYASASAGTNYGVYGKTNSDDGYAGFFEGGRNYFEGNVGIGTTTPDAKLDVEVTSGGAATIGSSTNSATGDHAVAMGDNAAAGGKASIATGTGTIAIGDYSTAMGYYTDAIGDYSTAMGTSTTASGYRSTAMGDITTAGGDYSTAMGYKTTASGYRSTSMGHDTTASGDYSTAMGGGTTASNYYSTAMGGGTTASGFYSTAMGSSTTASGDYSTAMGSYIEAAGDYSVAIALNDQFGVAVTQNNTMSIMGGRVGIDTTTPSRRFFVSGDAGGTTAWYNDSDSRLKKNIVSIDNALEKVNKLRGVEFEWKDTDNHVEGRQIGFIGQETVEVVPEVVDVKDGRYSMQYAPLTALLVEAVKELKAENQALKTQLEVQTQLLKQRLEVLESSLQQQRLVVAR